MSESMCWNEKCTMNENFFVGHFQAPVMPGVLIVEPAQTGGI
jgi:3-hydroxymyristoyl/3-hydroxydecanoyl-(acyl carrier protein) dehydratase